MSKEKVTNLQDGEDNEAPIELRDFLAEDCMKLDGLNDAIVGVDTKGYLVYDYHKIVDVFTKEPHGMEFEEAIEFTDFNVVGLDGNGNWTIIYNRENYV
jgi:hypothetical protein